MHSFELQAGDEDYVVSYADLLPEMKGLVPAQILEKLRDDFVQRTSGAKLVGSKPFRLDGKPGLSWVIEANARGGPTYRIKMAAVVAGDRLYQYGFVGPRDTFDEVAVDRYLETFELAPR